MLRYREDSINANTLIADMAPLVREEQHLSLASKLTFLLLTQCRLLNVKKVSAATGVDICYIQVVDLVESLRAHEPVFRGLGERLGGRKKVVLQLQFYGLSEAARLVIVEVSANMMEWNMGQ